MVKVGKNLKVQLLNINGYPYLKINSEKFNLSIELSIHRALQELRSLGTDLEIKFENFVQFTELINQVNKFHKNN